MTKINPIITKSSMPANLTRSGYSRLKRVFISSQNYRNYDKIVSGAKNKIIGNIPKELLNIILIKFPQNKADKIKELQEIFAQTAIILKDYEKAHLDFLKNPKDSDEERFLIHAFTNYNIKLLESKNETDILNKAKEFLKTKFDDFFGEKHNIKISHLGEGCFSNAFKIIVKNSENKRILDDRVIKIYKDSIIASEIKKEKFEYLKKLLSKYSDWNILKILRLNHIEVSNEESFYSKMKTSRRHSLKKTGEDEYKRWFVWLKREAYRHGIKAEANSYLRLKTLLGHHLMDDNAVDIDMFDIKSGFSLAKFANIFMPKVTKEIPFENLGIEPQDLNPRNTVCGRIIDYGAFIVRDNRFLDKTVLKFYKKIVNRNSDNEKRKVIENFQKLIQNPKTPHRNKIKIALEIFTDNFENRF